MHQKIIQIISKILGEEFNYDGTDMIEDGILDSLEMMEVIASIEREFAIEIDAEEIIPENFKTVDTIMNLIKKTDLPRN